MKRPARLAVLLSGRGSNCLAIQDAIERGDLPAVIVRVISNEPDAQGLERAEERGIEAVAIPHRGAGGRAGHEALVLAELAEAGAEWICLAGYMRLLSADFVARFPQRILNIHPSLLPAFPGLEAQRQALEYGVKLAGCTVHLVDATLDGGPIVLQRSVSVLDGDSPETLAARILEQEHLAYPAALRRLLTESWRIVGRRVEFGLRDALPQLS